eukprot:365192-Chlamydomonas_euryale.AAC.5
MSQVLYTSGGPALWSTTYSAGRLINPKNAASQAFDPQDRSALNRAEYADGLWVTASGTYEELVGNMCGDSLRVPCTKHMHVACDA